MPFYLIFVMCVCGVYNVSGICVCVRMWYACNLCGVCVWFMRVSSVMLGSWHPKLLLAFYTDAGVRAQVLMLAESVFSPTSLPC